MLTTSPDTTSQLIFPTHSQYPWSATQTRTSPLSFEALQTYQLLRQLGSKVTLAINTCSFEKVQGFIRQNVLQMHRWVHLQEISYYYRELFWHHLRVFLYSKFTLSYEMLSRLQATPNKMWQVLQFLQFHLLLYRLFLCLSNDI